MTHELWLFRKSVVTGFILSMALILLLPAGHVFAKQEKKCRHHGYHHSPKGKLGTVVCTSNGKIRGARDDNSTWTWQGIPFAAPPVDDLRWKAPVASDRWRGIRPAVEFSDQCPQLDSEGNYCGNEDCLYLNIWRPATQERGLPVYFWIHGGGNSIGFAGDPMYHGDIMADRTNMVVVTTNYRLGPMGWFSHPDMGDGESTLDSSGNYGNLDIIAALQWVQDNIAAFGGDPGNVTIAGESAGGFNVCALIISPMATNLFHKAISQSGGFRTTPPEAGYDFAQDVIDNILADDGLVDPPDDLAAYLRNKSPEEIFGAVTAGLGGMLDGFVSGFADGEVIHAAGADALNDPNSYIQVPTILGTNKEEYKLFMQSLYGTMPDDAYQEMTAEASVGWQISGVNEPATAMSAHPSQPGVYAYQFNYGAYNLDGFNAWPTDEDGVNYAIMVGASHGLEMPFFFGNYGYLVRPDLIFSEDNRPGYEALTADMMAYLSAFARTGAPGNAGGVFWHPWYNNDGGPKRILLDADHAASIIEMGAE